MAARRHERTYARKQAIQVLYQAEILEKTPTSLLNNETSFIDGAKPSSYASTLVAGIEAERPRIDRLLGEYSENWAVDRMPALDRAILRLACYEMAFVREVPVSVAINEAVDLAKEYGGEDESHRFVNGVLGRIAEYLSEHGGELPGADGSAPVQAQEEAPAAEADDSAPAAGAADEAQAAEPAESTESESAL